MSEIISLKQDRQRHTDRYRDGERTIERDRDKERQKDKQKQTQTETEEERDRRNRKIKEKV